MKMPKIFTCPKCKITMKSRSGWTLHVKTCCPEHRYRKTVVKMEIEFDIPVALDADEPRFGRRGLRGSLPTTPMDIFNTAFWGREIKGVGNCQIVAAQVLDQKIYQRAPTRDEQRALQRSTANEDRNAAVRECRIVLEEAIGKSHGMNVATFTREWPQAITFFLYSGNQRRYMIEQSAQFTFKFMHQSGVVEVGKGVKKQDPKTFRHVHPQNYRVRLADPAVFDQIRTFTGLQPSSVGYTCPKCSRVMKSKSGFTLHTKTCK